MGFPGISSFKSRKKEAVDTIRKTTGTQLEAVAETLASKSKAHALTAYTQITGNNRRSIRSRKSGPFSFRVGTETGYGGWLEIGTSKMSPRPYFAPAWAATAKKVAEEKWGDD